MIFMVTKPIRPLLLLTALVASVAPRAQTSTSQSAPSQDALLARLAIEVATDHDPLPLSLDADGSGHHGVVYDRFTHAVLAARVAQLKGTPLDPSRPPASLLSHPLVVVALPLACGSRTVAPLDVDLDHQGQVAKWQPASGRTIDIVLPGGHVPAGAIAVQFADTTLFEGEVVHITYAGVVCAGTDRTVDLRVSMTTPRPRSRPSIELPAGNSAPSRPITLNVGGVVDQDGRLRYTSVPASTTGIGASALAWMRTGPLRAT